jgi:5-amino-6-(5-phosphoribosylamino)uracil reductase
VLLSAAMSADGYLDDASGRRLVLSGAADLDRVDELRAGCDAILVGATTLRRDDPRLRVRSAARRAARAGLGLPPGPVRVVLSGSGELDPAARFFAGDDGVSRLAYVRAEVAERTARRLGSAATVIGLPAGPGAEAGPGSGAGRLPLELVLADLAGRGAGRLMVEGGSAVLGQFLRDGLADEFQLAVAPVLVGDPAAPRLVTLPGGPGPGGGEPGGGAAGGSWPAGLALAEVGRAGEVAVLRYRLIGT